MLLPLDMAVDANNLECVPHFLALQSLLPRTKVTGYIFQRYFFEDYFFRAFCLGKGGSNISMDTLQVLFTNS